MRLQKVWDAESFRPIFQATMSLQQFYVLSGMIRFDNKDTRLIRWRNNKLADNLVQFGWANPVLEGPK